MTIPLDAFYKVGIVIKLQPLKGITEIKIFVMVYVIIGVDAASLLASQPCHVSGMFSNPAILCVAPILNC